MVRSTSGSMTLGAAVLAALFFPAFTSWCFIRGLKWGVSYSFNDVVQFLVFSLLMAALILTMVLLVMKVARTSSVGSVAMLLVGFLAAFLLVLLGTFWVLAIQWYGGPLVWDLLFGPTVRSVWIYALPVVAGLAYAGLVVAVCRRPKGAA